MISSDTSLPGFNAIYVQDIKDKVLSQINNLYPFRAMKVLPDPRDNGRWLFYTYNDQQTVYLDAVKYNWQVPLQRESKRFQSIQRNDNANPKIEYFGQVIPYILDDIDGDKRLELVCLGADGFTANPRGLIVYDFISGNIKWKYDTPCNITGLLWQDFDLDGKKELAFGTYAFKNTQREVNGLSDTSGWIVVLSTEGKLLYSEKQFDGYGQVNLDLADMEQDGKLEIYAINTTWGNEVNRNAITVFNWTGKKLQRKLYLPLANTLERPQFADFLKRMDIAGTKRLHLVDKSKGLIVLDEVLHTVPHKLNAYVKTIWAIEDINQDGNKEILLLTDDNYLMVLDKHYNCRAKIKNPFPNENTFSMNIVRTGVDNDLLISIGSSKEVRYYKYGYLPFYTRAYNLFIHFSPYISLLLVVIMILLYLRLIRRLKVPFMGADYLSDGIILMKDSERILHCNKSAILLAKHSKDLTCKSLEHSFPQIHDALQSFAISKLNNNQIELVLFPEQNSGKYSVTMIRVNAPQSKYLIVCHACDIDNNTIKDTLQWADIARRLSHHVRRHITNIMLSLQALQQDTDSERQEYYRIISSEVDKVRVFTHAFQRFTEMKEYDLRLHDIIPSLEHCLARTTIPSNVKLLKNWSLQSLMAYIEPIRFEEAVVNSINNALEAMPEGGTLHITAKSITQAYTNDRSLNVLIEVEDSGLGIPAKYMEDIFLPFFTTKQNGTGIGIPETKKIIESMGGLMNIQSEEGVGTTVSFWLRGEA